MHQQRRVFRERSNSCARASSSPDRTGRVWYAGPPTTSLTVASRSDPDSAHTRGFPPTLGFVPGAADDRVLPATRGVAAGTIPFLVPGFAILYFVPGRTGQLFAWPIAPTMTSMLLASAYAGGVWFFVGVLRTRRWHTVAAGFPVVTFFATLLGLATFVHWDRFTHGHVAFWVWTALYVVAPFLMAAVWVANRRTAVPRTVDEPRLGAWTRRVFVAVGVVSVSLGAVLVLVPGLVSYVWPWAITSLTGRVVGAVLSLGVAGFAVLTDDRCSSVIRLVEVATVMAAFAALAMLRARVEIVWNRPLAWAMVAGLAVILVGGGLLLVRLRPARRPEDGRR
jgi:hypothetical protein